MSVQARVNEMFGGGGGSPTSVTVSSASQIIAIPDTGAWIELSNTTAGSITIGASNAVFSIPSWSRNRTLWLYGSGTQDIVLTNTNGTTTAGYCDLGGSNITLGPTDVLCLRVRADGSLIRVMALTDN